MGKKKDSGGAGGSGGSGEPGGSGEGVGTTDRFNEIIKYIIMLCEFPEDSTMVKYIEQQQWTTLVDVITQSWSDIEGYYTVKDDGSREAAPLNKHCRWLYGFILYYEHKCDQLVSTLTEHDVLDFEKDDFDMYMLAKFMEKRKEKLETKPTTVKTEPGWTAAQDDKVTVSEFRRGVKRDKTHYGDLKEDKFFNVWNRNFVATAHMHHTDIILNPNYVPKTDEEKAIFQEVQTFMYAVLEDHLKTDKGKSLVSQYEMTRDAQSIYRELKDHATSSTAAQLAGDNLLQYITTARFPGNWKGNSYSFVLHWKQQVMNYEKIENASLNPVLKLRMLQNSVGEVTELSYVKQMSDQEVARGSKPLDYEAYLHLLLSACSTYDKNFSNTSKPKRTVYQAVTDMDMDDNEAYDDVDRDTNEFQVDTDISEILAYNTNFKRDGGSNTSSKGKFLPRDEWNKLTQVQKDALIEKRRKERSGIGGNVNSSGNRRVNFHSVDDVINIDDIIDYTVMSHKLSVDDNGSIKEDDGEDTLLAYLSGQSQPNSGDIRKIMASKRSNIKGKSRKANETEAIPSSVVFGDKTYHLNKGETIEYQGHQYTANFTYRVGKHQVNTSDKALIDRGANGGVVGNDMLVVESSQRTVDVSGLAGHTESKLPIVTAQALIKTHQGDVIATFHQMALLGSGKSILSCIQMEHHGAQIDDKSSLVPGGTQRIIKDGYQIPLDINNGLPYLRCRKPTEEELATLPHIIMTSDLEWDPSVLDHNIDDMDKFYDADAEEVDHGPFDKHGEYKYRTVNHIDEQPTVIFVDAKEDLPYKVQVAELLAPNHYIVAYSIDQVKSKVNFKAMRPNFGFASAETIERTFDVTTRYARGSVTDNLKMHWRSRFPACNVRRRNEAVATDTVFSDTPAVDCGVKAAQLFVGRESYVADIYPVKTDKEFVNTLLDSIRLRGAMDKLISDLSQAQNSNRVKDVLRAYHISDWRSEAAYHHQNFAEIRYATIKQFANRMMNLSGAPANTWLLALSHTCTILNHLSSPTLGNKTPLQVLTGQLPDISKFMTYSFYEPVYYQVYDDRFPSKPKEDQGWWVGVAEHVGDALTYKILTLGNQVLFRSSIRTALDPSKRNLRLSPLGGEPESNQPSSNHQGDKIFIRSRFGRPKVNEFDDNIVLKNEVDDIHLSVESDDIDVKTDLVELDDDPNVKRRMITIDPEDLIGRTFLKETEDDGQRHRARIVRAIIDHEYEVKRDPKYIKFLCEVPNSMADEIISYNEVLDFIEKEEQEMNGDSNHLWGFRRISGHQGPLNSKDKDWKGSSYNVLVEWETGETTYEPLDMIASDDPVTCAEYARDQGLLSKPGWRRFKRIIKNNKIRQRIVSKVKSSKTRHLPFWKFSFLVPRTHAQAMELDASNGNTKWKTAEDTELSQLIDYKTFIDLGKGAEAPEGYKRIRCHIIYDVKHDGRHKARIVADGHLTDVNTESVYSGVVSLRGIRMIVFLAELNCLIIWVADVGNAYLEAKTKEKVYIIAGPEFGTLQGHTLVIDRALYGLRSSGLCWHERFADVLRSIGFVQSKAEADIWMREKDGLYEYIAVYVDDLLIAARNPEEIVKILQEVHGFKLKGVGPIEYHLGCDYFRDKDNVLCFGPKKYINKIMDQFEKMFGTKAKEYTSPLEKGDHPEVDTSEELEEDGIKQYQTMIGCLQWAVSLGRFDIQTAVMTMSRFRVAPRKGHLERLKRIYGYLRKFANAAIRVKVDDPDVHDLPDQNFDWCNSVYGNVKELIAKDAPKPLGKAVTTVSYMDANLYHDMLTGRAVTGVLHFCNQTLVDSYSKRQATVETATFGSEFTAARIAVDQILDLRITLRYLGVPVNERSIMFGDNKAVVTNGSIPHSTLNKRHNALAYHRVREMIAAKVLGYFWIDGKKNPADIVSKHWGYQQVYQLMKPILFYTGDTADLLDRDELNIALNSSE